MRRQGKQPIAAATVVFLRAHHQTPAAANQRVIEIVAAHAGLSPTQRDAQPNAQVALYEFIQGAKSGARKGAYLDVFA